MGQQDDEAGRSVLLARLEALREANPMMGLRGCRLGILHPEISEMQVAAMFEAAAALAGEGRPVGLHVMVPLVGLEEELANQVPYRRAG